MYKIIDALLDKRMAYYWPMTELRKISFKETSIDEIKIMLTFDIECDFGSKGDMSSSSSIGPFLEEIQKITGSRPSTFFVQGNLIEKFHKKLKSLEDNNEIGLHGYAHELWGKCWFTDQKVSSKKEREKLMELSLKAFEEYSLNRPICFRAPNMVIDQDSFDILHKNRFKWDSSFASYRGVEPLISKVSGITEIPVTCSPIPEMRLRAIPSLDYKVFNMHNLAGMNEEYLHKYVMTVAGYQISKKQDPLLVFLAHPWEFIKSEQYPYTTKENYRILSRFINYIENNFKIRWITGRDLT